MKRSEYTYRVLAAMRRVTAAERTAIQAELDAHIEDHMEALLDLGYEPKLAEQRTMERMGDPEEVGRELDKQYPRRWLIIGRAAMVLTILLAPWLAGPLWERLPDAKETLQVRWAPKTLLDISQVREDFDPLGLPACDWEQEVTIRDMHFRIYQVGYRDDGHVVLASVCWRTNPLGEILDWMDGYSLKATVNGEEKGVANSPMGAVSRYEIWAKPGDELMLIWEVYGETETMSLTLPYL